MRENEQRGLRRVDVQLHLPIGFELLPQEERVDIVRQLARQDVNVRGELMKMKAQSDIAEHDLANLISTVEQFDQEKKIYTVSSNLKTGSGKIDVQIRGGDTKFILPIIFAVGIVAAFLILILAK